VRIDKLGCVSGRRRRPLKLEVQAMPDHATDDQAREFAAAFRALLEWVHSSAGREGNEVSELVRQFLEPEGARHSVVTRELPAFEHVNLQTAVDAWSTRTGRAVEIRGIAVPPHWGGLSLQQLVAGEALPPLRLTAPALADLPNGPGTTLGCLRLALLLVTDEHGRYVVMIQAPNEHQPRLQVEVAGLPVGLAQQMLADLDRLRAELNVYRGHLLDVAVDAMGQLVLTFAGPPGISRGDVVLPVTVLARVERHALGVADHREALLAAGQHLKRGLLLYGPPGTGKTHTTRYLLGKMTGYTRLVLTGRSLVAVGAVTDLARALLPAVVVLEDVDLVAEERSLGPASSPVLFDLLDAMDGAAPDADLLFLLTTNRADLLEPALAARPGRVDVAVEIALPDAIARERLLSLYGRSVPLAITSEDVNLAVERTDGTTASFLKELIRRSVLEALQDDRALTAVTGEHLARALDDLLDAAQAVTRTLLGVGVDPADLPAGGLLEGPGRAARMAYGQRIMRRRLGHYSG
jgi:ATPase family associated with various cellular activities (AAA)